MAMAQKTAIGNGRKRKSCDKCKKREVVNFCRDCDQFICAHCMEPHEKLDEFKSHNIDKYEEVEMASFRQERMVCTSVSETTLDLFCDTCGEYIHGKDVLHKGHECHKVSEDFEKLERSVSAAINTVDQQMKAVKQHVDKVKDQQARIEVSIVSEIGLLKDCLENRKRVLIAKLKEVVQSELDGLATQERELEEKQTKLDKMLPNGANMETIEDPRGLVSTLMQQVKEMTDGREFPYSDVVFSCESLYPACAAIGQICCQPACPSKCYIEVGCIEVESSRQSTVSLLAFDNESQKCLRKIPNALISCKLLTNEIMTGMASVEHVADNRYHISFVPTVGARQKLAVRIQGEHIRGSPYSLQTELEVECHRTIYNCREPWGIAISDQGLAVVPEFRGHCVSLFDVEGKKVMGFGSEGSGHGQFRGPRCVAIDRDGNMLISDGFNHRILKFSPEGQFLQAVGQRGKKQLEFEYLDAVVFGPKHRLYVCDDRNHRVQILNPDLTFHSSFGGFGSGDGEMNYPYDIAFDSRGHLYLAESHNHRVQVFTADGQFLRKFGRRGRQPGELMNPTSIYIDSEDRLYLTEKENHRISVFTTRGEFIHCFGKEGSGEVEFKYPHGITMNKDGLIFITDKGNDRIKIFKLLHRTTVSQ